MADVCNCGLLTHKKLGTRIVDGVELCNKCQKPLHFTPGIRVAAPAESCIVTTLD